MNPVLKIVSDNLNNFIENLNCLRDTFCFSEGTLKQQLCNVEKHYKSFVSMFNVSTDSGKLDLKIPEERIRQFRKLEISKFRAEKALSLIPPSFIVSMVSIFDSFYSGLVRCLYALNPKKLLESNMELHYRDFEGFDTVNEIKKMVIDNTIEDLLRKSHVDQIEWLEKAMGVGSLKHFDGWSIYVELTERRNLFVHSDGVVSRQYIEICKKQGVDVKNISIGSKLMVDKNYFDSSFFLLYRMSIMLTQILINKHYIGNLSNDTGERDIILFNNLSELIIEKHYDVAIGVLEFANENQFHRTAKDQCYIILNLAQSYKWKGDNAKCLTILEDVDTSTWNDELLIQKFTLQDNFDEVYKKMEALGAKNEVLSIKAYREWPIFRNLRVEKTFAELFEKIFGEPLLLNQPIFSDDLELVNDNTISF